MKDLLFIPAITLIIIGIFIIEPLVPDTFQAHNIGAISTTLEIFGGIILGILFTKIIGENNYE